MKQHLVKSLEANVFILEAHDPTNFKYPWYNFWKGLKVPHKFLVMALVIV
jgi:hypothetical protein